MNVSTLFVEEPDHVLPRFTGGSFEAHVTAFLTVGRLDKKAHLYHVAVAASLERQSGQRTGATVIQRFCREVHISAPYFSRLMRVAALLAGPVVPGYKTLVLDDRLTFKHIVVAANHSPLPWVALGEAVDNDWSANELLRRIAGRKGRTLLDLDGTDSRPDADDDDPQEAWQNAPTPRRESGGRVPQTHSVTFTFTRSERRTFSADLRAAAQTLGTDNDHDTIIAMARTYRFPQVAEPADELPLLPGAGHAGAPVAGRALAPADDVRAGTPSVLAPEDQSSTRCLHRLTVDPFPVVDLHAVAV